MAVVVTWIHLLHASYRHIHLMLLNSLEQIRANKFVVEEHNICSVQIIELITVYKTIVQAVLIAKTNQKSTQMYV